MIQLHSGSIMLQGGVPTPIPAAGSGRDKTMAYQTSAVTTGGRGRGSFT